jgi:RTX calcium-binding nonapeptide repeat (4 copies)
MFRGNSGLARVEASSRDIRRLAVPTVGLEATRRATVLSVLLGVAVAGAPGPAAASEATHERGNIVYRGDTPFVGEANSLVVDPGPGPTSMVRLTDIGVAGLTAPIVVRTPGMIPPCRAVFLNTADCPSGGFIALDLRDRSDAVEGANSPGRLASCGGGGTDVLRGGGSGDVLEGGAQQDELHGRAGDDFLDGDQDADVVAGDAGDDVVFGGGGDDLLRGGEGADLFRGDGRSTSLIIDPANPPCHELPGPGGTDTVSYRRRTDPVRVVIDGGAGDGEQGEDDFVGTDVENVVGGRDDDVLLADSGFNRLNGRAGHDLIAGRPGSDTLLGGPGNDRLAGGGDLDPLLDGGDGNDWINSSGDLGAAFIGDDVVCGRGQDEVFADRDDSVAADCETVTIVP